MKMIYQPLGTTSLVGIETDNEEERMQQYWSFWNHGATTGDLHEMCDTFHYITTSVEKLEKYFLNSSLHLVLNKFPDAYKGFEGGAMPHARALAKRRFEELRENTEVFYSTQRENYDYSVSKSESLVVNQCGIASDEEEWKQKAHEHLQSTSAKRLG